ncbi:MAG: hypothetical protein ACLTQI_03290 [Slackia sp.]
MSRGGYLGAGVSWALLELLGRLVGCIVMVGVACGGAVVIGFSVSGALRLVQEKASDIRERRVRRKEEREDAAGTALDAPAYAPAPEPAPARIRRADVIPRVPRDLASPSCGAVSQYADSRRPISHRGDLAPHRSICTGRPITPTTSPGHCGREFRHGNREDAWWAWKM